MRLLGPTLTAVVALGVFSLGTQAFGQTLTPATETAIPSDTATPVLPTASATAETPALIPATPLPRLEASESIVGYVIQDVDGDGLRGAGDAPAHALVELFQLSGGYPVSGAGLFTDEQGRFEFVDLPPGEYVLWVWWPEFVSLQGVPPAAAVESNPHLLLLGITIGEDGMKHFKYVTVKAEGQRARVEERKPAGVTPFEELVILVKPQPEGTITWPVRAGQVAIPVGHASLGTVVALPPSGSGQRGTAWPIPWVAGVVGTALFAVATGLLQLGRRSRI